MNQPGPLVLNDVGDLTLALAEKVGFHGMSVEFGEAARATIALGRARFERLLAQPGGYIYGVTTAPGNRAKKQLDAAASQAQGTSLAALKARQPGLATTWLPPRAVRLALLARLANGLSGQGKLTFSTLDAIRSLLDGDPPPVPLDGMAGPGEVMAASWLLAPIAGLPLAPGEAMALINGSPFASAFACDAAITSKRRLDLARQVFALSIEAARAPLGHYDPRLGDLWPDPHYAAALRQLTGLLQGACPDRLPHQAPVAWRIIPNILAVAESAALDAEAAASLALRSLKDNPTFVGSPDAPEQDAVVSSGGYHDHRSCRALDILNAVFADLCVLAQRQVARLVSGHELGLPHLLAPDASAPVGTEYLAWTLTSTIARARQAAVPATLDLSLEDPGGNQSDIAEPAFIAYARHLESARCLDECLAVLAVAATIALRLRDGQVPPPLRPLFDQCQHLADPAAPTSAAAGQMLRRLIEEFAARATGSSMA